VLQCASVLYAKFVLLKEWCPFGGMVMRPSVEVKLSADERNELERLARGRKVWRGLSDRAHIVLLAAEGLTNVQIGSVLGVTNQTARKWRNRFAEHRLDPSWHFSACPIF